MIIGARTRHPKPANSVELRAAAAVGAESFAAARDVTGRRGVDCRSIVSSAPIARSSTDSDSCRPRCLVTTRSAGLPLAADFDVLSVLSVLACPSCPTNIDAKSLVFSEAFVTNATYALIPFLVVGFVVHRFVKRLDEGVRDEEQRHG